MKSIIDMTLPLPPVNPPTHGGGAVARHPGYVATAHATSPHVDQVDSLGQAHGSHFS